MSLKCGVEVGVEILLTVFKERRRFEDTCVVDKHIDSPKALDCCEHTWPPRPCRYSQQQPRSPGRIELGSSLGEHLLAPTIEHYIRTLKNRCAAALMPVPPPLIYLIGEVHGTVLFTYLLEGK